MVGDGGEVERVKVESLVATLKAKRFRGRVMIQDGGNQYHK